MAFRFRLYLESGDDVGEFATAVPDWHVGQEFLDKTHTRYRIENIMWDEDLPGDDYHGLFVVTPIELAEP
jgi:hypothetical protein